MPDLDEEFAEAAETATSLTRDPGNDTKLRLYALYKPADDPKTGKPLDATKAAGEWNHMRIVISPCKG